MLLNMSCLAQLNRITLYNTKDRLRFIRTNRNMQLSNLNGSVYRYLLQPVITTCHDYPL